MRSVRIDRCDLAASADHALIDVIRQIRIDEQSVPALRAAHLRHGFLQTVVSIDCSIHPGVCFAFASSTRRALLALAHRLIATPWRAATCGLQAVWEIWIHQCFRLRGCRYGYESAKSGSGKEYSSLHVHILRLLNDAKMQGRDVPFDYTAGYPT